MICIFPTVLCYYNREFAICQPLFSEFCPPFFFFFWQTATKIILFSVFATHGSPHMQKSAVRALSFFACIFWKSFWKSEKSPKKVLHYACGCGILYASFAGIMHAKYGGVLKWPKRSVLKTERSFIATRGFNSLHLRQQKTHFCLPTKVRFLHDVCLRQMMTATPNDAHFANDVCLAAHWASIASLRPTGATSYLRSNCIISPQAMHHLTYWRFCVIIKLRKAVGIWKYLKQSRLS